MPLNPLTHSIERGEKRRNAYRKKPQKNTTPPITMGPYHYDEITSALFYPDKQDLINNFITEQQTNAATPTLHR